MSLNNVKKSTLTLTLTVLFLTLLSVNVVNLQKCEVKTVVQYYPNLRTQIICENIADSFPFPLPLNSTNYILSCWNCKITSFDSNTIKNFNGKWLNVSYSHVKTINKDAFSSFSPKVMQFRFDHNELTYLASGLFQNFTQLSLLSFNNNNLTRLEQNLFEGVATSHLDLSFNRIEDLTDVFNKLTVTKLDLSHNYIEEIPIGTFAEVKMINISDLIIKDYKSLRLSYNRLQKIQSGSFRFIDKITYMQLLGLSQNSLSSIENDTFDGLKLDTLDLSFNFIRQLETKSFNGIADLNTLYLHNNQIDNLPLGVFSTLNSLKILRIDNNGITYIGPTTFSGVPLLRELNMSHNQMKTLSDSVLAPLSGLNEMDISFNRLNTLNLTSILEYNKNLRQLKLNNNFWQCAELIEMYVYMMNDSRSLDVQSNDFHVPNVHGIPCSNVPVEVTHDLTFDKFLTRISEDMNSKFDDVQSEEDH